MTTVLTTFACLSIGCKSIPCSALAHITADRIAAQHLAIVVFCTFVQVHAGFSILMESKTGTTTAFYGVSNAGAVTFASSVAHVACFLNLFATAKIGFQGKSFIALASESAQLIPALLFASPIAMLAFVHVFAG